MTALAWRDDCSILDCDRDAIVWVVVDGVDERILDGFCESHRAAGVRFAELGGSACLSSRDEFLVMEVMES